MGVLRVLLWPLLISAIKGSFLMCPTQCQCDNMALKATCSGANLKVVPISFNPRLSELHLSRNGITNLMDALTVYQELHVLDLASNNVDFDKGKKLSKPHKLQHLNLSNNLIEVLENTSFHKLDNLQTLVLSQNALKSLEKGVFHNLTELEHLDLSINQITSIDDDAFLGLTNLRVLNLKHNRLFEVPTKTFASISNLSILDLSFNPLNMLKENSFSALVNLESLLLNNCHIKNVTKYTFRLLRSLMTLRLDGNELEDVPRQLQDVRKLEELYIGGNLFHVIKANAFRKLTHLSYLAITDCPFLTRVEKDAFIDNPNLEEITISFNKKLEHLEDGCFNGLHHLKNLTLTGNNLKTFSPSLVSWNMLELVDIRENAIECNCSLLWLVQEINLSNHSQEMLEQTRCASPYQFRNKKLVNISLNCESFARGFIIGFTVAMCFVFLITASFLWMMRGKIKKCISKKKVEYQKADNKGDLEEQYIIQATQQFIKLNPVTEL